MVLTHVTRRLWDTVVLPPSIEPKVSDTVTLWVPQTGLHSSVLNEGTMRERGGIESLLRRHRRCSEVTVLRSTTPPRRSCGYPDFLRSVGSRSRDSNL